MYDFPIKYFEDNLIFNEDKKTFWAAFQIIGFNYDYLSKDRKEMLLHRISRFIANIGTEAKLLIVPVAQDIKSHYENLKKELSRNDVLYEYAVSFADGIEAHLSEKLKEDGAVSDYNIYLIVKFNIKKTPWTIVQEFIGNPLRVINEFFGVAYKEIYLSEIKEFTELANAYLNEQYNRIRMVKTSAETTQWLIKRMLRRGIAQNVSIRRKTKGGEVWLPGRDEVLKDGEKAIRPHESDILTLTEGLIEPGKKNMTITNSDGKVSYQAFLALTGLPDGIVFPNGEWLMILQDYPIVSEVCVHITTVEHRESIKKISNKKREIDSQVDHVAQNDKVPDELFEAQENADELEAELKRSRDPLINITVLICLASENKKVLYEEVRYIRERYEDMNFTVEWPMADQFKMFMEFIPGAGRHMTDYIMRLPPITLAGSMFPATRLLGDNMGTSAPFIGTTGVLEKMVFLNMARACQVNRSASAAFLGTLGQGKSFNANLLLYLHVLHGSKALIVDPKGERSLWPDMLPALKGHISITTLSAGEEDRGKLDPFLIYSDSINSASELALNVICELFKINPKDEEYTALMAVLGKIKSVDRPCMSKLVELLNSFSNDDDLKNTAKNLGRRIELIKEVGMAKLLFGEGDERGLSFDNKINIIQVQNLSMPDPNTPKEDYTQEETISTVLMLPIASFALRFAASDRTIFKPMIFDESWALSTTAAGIKLLNALARLGRSQNAAVIFIGHSVTDLKGDGIKAAITYKFCFRAPVREEAERVLDFLDLEITDENISTVQNLPNGTCLFQDLDGRVGKLKFEAVYNHVIRAFNTTPNAV